MEKLVVYLVAVILAASIAVAYIQGEAAMIRRDKEPLTFWGFLALNVGSLSALLVWAATE